MFTGILFDMDGVLFDTERQFMRIESIVAKEMGHELSFEVSASMLGRNTEVCKQLTLEALGTDFDYDYFVDEVKKRGFSEMDNEGIRVKKGAYKLLEYLQNNQYKIAVASSSTVDTIKHHLTLAKMEHYFAAIVGGDMIQASKPAPDIFIRAAKAIDLYPGQCIAIEDSFNGLQSASTAGCFTIMVPDVLQPTKEVEPYISLVCNSLCDIPKILPAL